MPLNKDILGTALYNVRNTYSNKTHDELITAHGSMEAARLAQAKDEAQAIIDHFKDNSLLNIPGTGMMAGSVAVSGTSITGTIS